MKLFKGSLLEEVRAQCCNKNDDDNNLMTSIKNYFNMFDSGVVEKSVQCSVCNGIDKEQTPFEELLLYFDNMHHDENSKSYVLFFVAVQLTGVKSYRRLIFRLKTSSQVIISK